MHFKTFLTVFLSLCFSLNWCAAQQPDWVNPAEQWQTVGPEKGAIIIIGGSADEWAVARFLEMVGGPDAKIVLIPTAGNVVDENNSAYVALKKVGAKNVTILHTKDPKEADSDAFVAPLLEADGAYISGGFQKRLAESYLHTKTHKALFDLLARDGVVAGNSAGASIQGSYLYGGREQKEGFGFVRDSAVGQHYVRRNRMGGVARILREQPNLIGFGVDEDAAALVRGNELEVIGMGQVAMYDTGSEVWKERDQQIYLSPGDRYDLAERTVLHREKPLPTDSWAGAGRAWSSPAKDWRTQGPERGTLLLYGGKTTPEMLTDFLDTVGRSTPIAVVSSGIDVDEQANEKVVEELRKLGASKLVFLHTIDNREANSEAFTAALDHAGAVWLCDSLPEQQWRQVNSYARTLLNKKLFDLLQRGGTVAGNGTGAGMLSDRQFTAGFRWDDGYGLLLKTSVFAEPLDAKGKVALKKFAESNPNFMGIGLPEGAKLVVRANEVAVTGAPVTLYEFVKDGDKVTTQTHSQDKAFSLSR